MNGNLMTLLQQLRGAGVGSPNMNPSNTMAQGGGGQVSRTPIQAPQVQQQQQADPMAAALRGAVKFNDASGGGLNRMLGMGGVTGKQIGQAAAQYGPEVAKMGGSVLGGGAGAGGMLGPLAGAAAGVMAAPSIGQGAGDLMDRLGLKKTGFPDQARAVGQFVGGDFGGAWDSMKSSVKNIFSIF